MRWWLSIVGFFSLSACLPKVGEKDKFGPVHPDKKNEVEIIAQKISWPQVISHDFGFGKVPQVPANRLFYNLTFEQPLILEPHDEFLVVALEENGPVVDMAEIKFNVDKTKVFFKLGPKNDGPLEPFKKYGVVSGKKSPSHDEARHIFLEFMAIAPALKFKENRPIKISPKSDGVEIRWDLNNAHQTSFRFGLKKDQLDCDGKPCLEITSLAREKRALSQQNLSFITISGLPNETKFYFSLKATDLQGQELVSEGDFSTTKASALKISEIMIKPKVAKGMQEHRGEFIEIKNISNKPLLLSGLMLGLENMWEFESPKCALKFAGGEAEIPAHSYALIVGHEFDGSLYNLPSNLSVFHLAKKTLCGGLANGYPQMIKIYDADGNNLDGYGAYLDAVEAGVSVARINVAGLDEPNNYCYSGQGSSPGAAHGSLTECAPKNN